MKPTVWKILEKHESSPPLSSVFRSSFAPLSLFESKAKHDLQAQNMFSKSIHTIIITTDDCYCCQSWAKFFVKLFLL